MDGSLLWTTFSDRIASTRNRMHRRYYLKAFMLEEVLLCFVPFCNQSFLASFFNFFFWCEKRNLLLILPLIQRKVWMDVTSLFINVWYIFHFSNIFHDLRLHFIFQTCNVAKCKNKKNMKIRHYRQQEKLVLCIRVCATTMRIRVNSSRSKML